MLRSPTHQDNWDRKETALTQRRSTQHEEFRAFNRVGREKKIPDAHKPVAAFAGAT
jgi:hypothetical protein